MFPPNNPLAEELLPRLKQRQNVDLTHQATVNDDWDAASLTFNLTRRDSGFPEDPLPIAGMTSGPVNSTYMIGATLCGTGGPTLVLTHGIIESKLYAL